MVGTCSAMCWMAKEEVCHCMCRGLNHGVMKGGGDQPGRYRQTKGVAYELVGIHDSYLDAIKERRRLEKEYNEAHSIPWYRSTVLMENGAKKKWPEVVNFLAALPEGTRFPQAYLIWVPKD